MFDNSVKHVTLGTVGVIQMNYQFPEIRHIDDVRDAIANSNEFVIGERQWGFVVCYVVMTPETFPEVKTSGGSAKMRDSANLAKAIRRECRGLLFDTNGNLISRPFHKFFNVGERDETQVHNIDLSRPHVILEKLDGSMVRPLPVDNSYRMATKMGITDVSMQAEVWLAGNKNYDDFIRYCIGVGVTPVFEWCSRKNRIVIDYPEDRMVLTAVRDNLTGNYDNYNTLQAYAEQYNLDLVRVYDGSSANMESLLTDTRGLRDQEGWVIRFDDGHMLKLKGEEYVSIHKAKDKILRENGVIDMLLGEKADDVKAFLPDDDRRRLEDYETKFWTGVQVTADVWKSMNTQIRRKYGNDRKAFALESAQTMDGSMKSAIFAAWDSAEFDWFAAVVNTIRKNIGTQPKVDAARGLWGGARWTYSVNTGDE